MSVVTVKNKDSVATVTLDSPQNRNALSRTLIAKLADALTETANDPHTRVIVLTHTGHVFCAGADLNESTDGGTLPVTLLPPLLRTISQAPVPVIVRVAGAARGGGLGLIAAADIVVASHHATFAFSEVRLGVLAAVITPLVKAKLHPRAASELLLTGDVFTGNKAEHSGLVTRSVPDEELDNTVASYVSSLRLAGPHAAAGVKKLLAPAPEPDWDNLAQLSARHFLSEEAQEGIKAFQEKRRPAWSL